MTLVGFQYEPVSLDVNKVCFDEKQDIPNTREKSEKVKVLLNSVDVGNGYKCQVLELRQN